MYPIQFQFSEPLPEHVEFKKRTFDIASIRNETFKAEKKKQIKTANRM